MYLKFKKERERKKIDKNITGHPRNGIDMFLDKLGLLFTGYLQIIILFCSFKG